MSETHKGEKNSFYGKTHSEEWKRKRRGENHYNWKGGKSIQVYSVDWTETLRKSIRERDKYTCQVCGKEPATYCHHIDYNKLNSNSDNLITLCKSCHIKTNSHREYWKQYFSYKIS